MAQPTFGQDSVSLVGHMPGTPHHAGVSVGLDKDFQAATIHKCRRKMPRAIGHSRMTTTHSLRLLSCASLTTAASIASSFGRKSQARLGQRPRHHCKPLQLHLQPQRRLLTFLRRRRVTCQEVQIMLLTPLARLRSQPRIWSTAYFGHAAMLASSTKASACCVTV